MKIIKEKTHFLDGQNEISLVYFDNLSSFWFETNSYQVMEFDPELLLFAASRIKDLKENKAEVETDAVKAAPVSSKEDIFSRTGILL